MVVWVRVAVVVAVDLVLVELELEPELELELELELGTTAVPPLVGFEMLWGSMTYQVGRPD